MLVAVTGAGGYVGRFVAAELLARGDRVRAWARPGTDRGGFEGPVAWRPGDLAEPDGFEGFLAGADAVVHAAYRHVPGRYRGGEGDDLGAFLDVNLTGGLRLLEAARAAGVRRFVFLSSRAVYGRRAAGLRLDEDHPTAPASHYGAYKTAVEAFCGSFSGDGFAACALRPTGVYGPTRPVERTKWFDLVADALDGRPPPPDRGGTEVHGADVARAVRLLLTAPDVAGRAFNCSDVYVTRRDVLAMVRERTGAALALPEPTREPPTGVMECRALRELGFAFGGRPLLERTVDGLIEAVRRRQAGGGRPPLSAG